MAARFEAPAIELAAVDDLAAAAALIERAGLSASGLADLLGSLLVVRTGGAVVGTAALEWYGSAALLRSVAVAAEWRGRGLGARLVAAALDLARRRGVGAVALLAETAAPFFARLGFAPVPRAAAPAAVQASEQFRSACPASAVCMVLDLT